MNTTKHSYRQCLSLEKTVVGVVEESLERLLLLNRRRPESVEENCQLTPTCALHSENSWQRQFNACALNVLSRRNNSTSAINAELVQDPMEAPKIQ